MITILKYPLAFAFGFLVTYLTTPLVIKACKRFGILDKPGPRRIHTESIPRCGGPAVFLGFHAAALLSFSIIAGSQIEADINFNWWLRFFAASCVLFAVGLIDDVLQISWFAKLGGQFLAVNVLYALGISAGSFLGMPLPFYGDYLFTLFWCLAFINAFNLIDGMDGLATGLASIAATGLACMVFLLRLPADVLLYLGFIGSCLAFLRFNFHPARVFLGDSGSMFLGFTLASLTLASNTKTTALAAIGVPLLAIGVPVFDTMLAVWRRSLRSILDSREKGGLKSLAKADMEHVHHRLFQAGLSQHNVALVLYALNFALVAVGLLSMVFHAQALGIFLAAFVVGTYIVVRHLARVELWDSGALILRGITRPKSPVVVSILYPAVDCCLLMSALWLSVWSTSAAGEVPDFRNFLRDHAPYWCGIPFICLAVAGIYNRVWSRARSSDFALLSLILLAGVLLSSAIEIILNVNELDHLGLRSMLYFGLSSFLITGLRALPRTLNDFMGRIDPKPSMSGAAIKKVLIYGAGLRCLLYLRRHTEIVLHNSERLRIVGLIDDERNLRKRFVHGYRVLGENSELSEIFDRYQVDQLVLAADLSQEKYAALLQLCSRKGVKLTEWKTELVDVLEASPIRRAELQAAS